MSDVKVIHSWDFALPGSESTVVTFHDGKRIDAALLEQQLGEHERRMTCCLCRDSVELIGVEQIANGYLPWHLKHAQCRQKWLAERLQEGEG